MGSEPQYIAGELGERFLSIFFMGLLYGYARVSAKSQEENSSLETQRESIGAQNDKVEIVCEVASGLDNQRPKLKKLLTSLKKGDSLTVWSTRRLSRSLASLTRIQEDLEERGVFLFVLDISKHESISSTTPNILMVFHMQGTVAQFEILTLKVRTTAGIRKAKELGRYKGKPPKYTEKQLLVLEAKYNKMLMAGMSLQTISKALEVSRRSLYRYFGSATEIKNKIKSTEQK
jgi:DNA invertase Pin-like site-specific DNA recombinase